MTAEYKRWVFAEVNRSRLRIRFRYLALGVLLINAVTLSPVLNSSWYGDDWPNSQTKYWSLWRHGSSSQLELFRDSIRGSVDWIIGQGRLNSVAVIESKFLFYWFPEVTSYKYLQYFVLLSCVGLFLQLVYLMTRSKQITLLTGVFATLVVQFRRDFDPHVGFSLIVPGMLVKVFVATIFLVLAVRVKSRAAAFFLVLAGLFCHVLALLTYEHALYLSLLLFCSVFLEWRRTGRIRRAKVILISVAIVVFCYFSSIVLLQAFFADGGRFSGSYSFATNPGAKARYDFFISTRTVPLAISQVLAGIPLITLKLPTDIVGNSFVDRAAVLWAAAALLISVVLQYCSKSQLNLNIHTPQSRVIDRHRRSWETFSIEDWTIRLIAGVMISVPGLLMAIRPASYEASRGSPWDPQNTYLHVLIVQFGVALASAVALNDLVLRKQSDNGYSKMRKTKRKLRTRTCGSMLALVCSLTFLHNHQVAAETGNRDLNLDAWNLILQDGELFDDVRDADMFVSPNVNDAYETNAANFFAQTGIRLAAIHPTFYLYSPEQLSCRPVENCFLPNLREETIRLQANLLKPDSESRNDWVHQTLSSDVLRTNSIWFIDFFPITQNSYVMFLGRIAENGRGPGVVAGTVRLVLVTSIDKSGEAREAFKPALNEVCLVGPQPTSQRGKYSLSYWKMPSGDVALVDGSRSTQDSNTEIDWRLLGFGICP